MIDLAVKRHTDGQFHEAEALYRKILEVQPNHADALHLYGVLAGQHGNFELSINLIERAIAIAPNMASFYSNLGNAYMGAGRATDAANSYKTASKLESNEIDTLIQMGHSLCKNNQLQEAIPVYTRIIELNQNIPEAHVCLGSIYLALSKFDMAIEKFYSALKLKPDSFEALNNLGIVYRHIGKMKEAIEVFNRAIHLRPDSVDVYYNFATLLLDYGDLDQALAAYKKTLSINENHIEVHSNLIFALHYHPDFDSETILRECVSWAKKFEYPLLCKNPTLTYDKSPNKKLKIGFVSPDLRDHPVGRFLLPLFLHHDNQKYDIFCYSNKNTTDPVALKLQNNAYRWQNIEQLTDQDAADLIRGDQIDILVDLSLHTAYNRLPLFAHKPAPVQITWLGYPGTTGMSSIDYRITDRYLDPEENNQFYSEKSIYITNYWCYTPPKFDEQLDINELPAFKSGLVTFGCLNNSRKISKATIQCWIRLLKEIANSQLLVYINEGDHRDNFISEFTSNGINASRIQIIGKQSYQRYFEEYQKIDIALDPFPWAGGTTTCDALWMGVPTITLRGKTAVGRGGASILSNVGLFDFIANSQDEYINIAKKLCSDLDTLASIRSGLREKMQKSPLMDAKQFAKEMERVFRQAWISYCSQSI